jgi:hypothetical protein
VVERVIENGREREMAVCETYRGRELKERKADCVCEGESDSESEGGSKTDAAMHAP